MRRLLREIIISLLCGLMVAAVVILAAVACLAQEVPDITEPCGYTEEELEEVLKGELKQHAQAFLHAEEDYGINACFLASIAALESGWGEHRFRENNIFGFGKQDFESVPRCIDFVAWYLRKHYLNPEGRYYRGGTIGDIGRIWCPDDGTWVRLVTGIFYKMNNGGIS